MLNTFHFIELLCACPKGVDNLPISSRAKCMKLYQYHYQAFTRSCVIAFIVIFFLSSRQPEGTPMAGLPFTPVSFLRPLTHRGLGEPNNTCTAVGLRTRHYSLL